MGWLKKLMGSDAFDAPTYPETTKTKDVLVQEVREFIKKVNDTKHLEEVKTDIFLKDGEHAYLEENSSLTELKSMTTRTGVGFGSKVAGIYAGTWRSLSTQLPIVRNIADGKLVITNKRLFFSGEMESRDIPLKKILDTKRYLDAIEISVEGKTHNYVFTVQNPHIVQLLFQILKHESFDPSNELNLDVKIE